MKRGSTFLVFVLAVFFAMGCVFTVRSIQDSNEANRSVQTTEAPREVSGGAVAQRPTKSPTVANTEAPTAEPTKTPTAAPTQPPTATPVSDTTAQENTEIAGVSREEIAAVAELMGVSEEEVELVIEKAAENGYTFDVEAIMAGEIDIQELWGVVTEALGEERAYELLIKALGANLF